MKVVLGPNTEMASLEHIVLSIALSTDAKRLVTGCKCGKMQVWDAHSFKEIITLQSPSSSVISVLKFFPGGSRFVSGTKDGILAVWDIAAGRSVFTVDDHTGRVACVAVSATEKIVASAHGKEIHIWDVESRVPITTFESSVTTKGL